MSSFCSTYQTTSSRRILTFTFRWNFFTWFNSFLRYINSSQTKTKKDMKYPLIRNINAGAKSVSVSFLLLISFSLSGYFNRRPNEILKSAWELYLKNRPEAIILWTNLWSNRLQQKSFRTGIAPIDSRKLSSDMKNFPASLIKLPDSIKRAKFCVLLPCIKFLKTDPKLKLLFHKSSPIIFKCFCSDFTNSCGTADVGLAMQRYCPLSTAYAKSSKCFILVTGGIARKDKNTES